MKSDLAFYYYMGAVFISMGFGMLYHSPEIALILGGVFFMIYAFIRGMLSYLDKK